MLICLLVRRVCSCPYNQLIQIKEYFKKKNKIKDFLVPADAGGGAGTQFVGLYILKSGGLFGVVDSMELDSMALPPSEVIMGVYEV